MITGAPVTVVVISGDDDEISSPLSPASTAHRGWSRVMSRHQNTGTGSLPMGLSEPTNKSATGRANKGHQRIKTQVNP